MRILAATLLPLVVAALPFAALPVAARPHTAAPPAWVASWGSSQQVPEPQNSLPPDDLRDATLRQTVHLSVGGAALRVHLSNAFGTHALRVTAAQVAKPVVPGGSAIDPATTHPLTFAGRAEVSIPPGAEMISDALPLAVAPGADLTLSIHLESPPDQQTGHPGSRATTYYVHGDLTSAADLPGAHHVDHWYQLTAVDVLARAPAATVVALGDSITDGHGATTNGNDRWPDALARRLQSNPATASVGVSNQGIGGNHLLTDGLGPNALARLDRDMLAPAGVRWVLLLEGVNDLGGLARTGEVPQARHDALVQQVLAAYQQIIDRAHAHGLRLYGATITPYVGSDYYHPGPLSEADRQAVNAWIRTAGHFDAVVDFDQAVRDPAHPDRLLPAFDCGDHLHPSPAGYQAMADAIPLALFAQ
ncbi:MAG: SGNH/GDSL hydrolase family protein [Acidobacteriota bacterium]|nr:SGNH/GDSL hydrolase family protein [Acidobacteriota bacterium]